MKSNEFKSEIKINNSVNNVQKENSKKTYTLFTEENGEIKFENALYEILIDNNAENKKLIIFCIGSILITGDSLGPIIGTKLSRNYIINNLLYFNKVYVYGTMNKTINALNIKNEIKRIENKFNKDNIVILAIDAAISENICIGSVIVNNKHLEPGAGVGKKLPYVGDLYISGVTCNDAQNLNDITNRETVFKIADFITGGIINVIDVIYEKYGLEASVAHE